MRLIPPTLEQNLESLSKIAAACSKLSVLAGGLCIIAYCLRISHFPQDLSVGDGLLFILAAACFGMVYMLFVGSLVSLGIALSPVTRAVYWLIFRGCYFIKRRQLRPAHKLAPFHWASVLFASFAVFIILAFGNNDSTAYWSLPLLSIGLYLFYSVYVSCGNHIKETRAIESTLVHTPAKDSITDSGDTEKSRTLQLFSLLTILLVPLFVGGVSGQLLDSAMRAANVRIEKPIIYVKEPYATLLPQALTSQDEVSPPGYTPFDGTDVLFKGFGKTTVVSFPHNSTTKKIEIPNDHIIVGDR